MKQTHVSHRLVGVRIEGLVFDRASTVRPILAFGNYAQLLSAAGSHWHAEMLLTIPESSSQRIDPIRGTINTASFNFDLAGTPDLRRQLMADSRSKITSISSSDLLTRTETSVAVEDLMPWQLERTVWIGTEAVRVVSEITAETRYNIERAQLGTRARTHEPGTLVTDIAPPLKFRKIELIIYTEGVERVIWTGFVQSITLRGAVLSVSCAEFLTGMSKVKVNQSSRDISLGNLITWQVDPGDEKSLIDRIVMRGRIKHIPRVQNLEKNLVKIALDIDGAPGTVDYDPSTETLDFESLTWLSEKRPKSIKITKDTPEGSGAEFTGPVFEILHVDSRYLPHATTSNLGSGALNPILIWLALMVSGTEDVDGDLFTNSVNVFSDIWGLDLGAFLNLEQIVLKAFEIANTCDIEQLTLGAGGKEFSPLRDLDKILLRPHGFFLASDANGLITVRSLELPSVDKMQEIRNRALPVLEPQFGGDIEIDNGETRAVDEVTVKIGETPFGRRASTVALRSSDNSARPGFEDINRHTFDLQTYRAQNLRALSGGVGNQCALYRAYDHLILGSTKIPQFSFDVAESLAPALETGVYYSIKPFNENLAYWMTRSGDLVTLADNEAEEYVQFVGLLTAKQINVKSGRTRVTLLMVPHRFGQPARLRSPVAEIESIERVNGKTVVTVVSIGFDGQFRAEGDNQFEAGDRIEFYNSVGEVVTTLATVQSTEGREIKLTFGFAAAEALDVISERHFIRYANASVARPLGIHSPLETEPWAVIGSGNSVTIQGVGTKEAYIYG